MTREQLIKDIRVAAKSNNVPINIKTDQFDKQLKDFGIKSLQQMAIVLNIEEKYNVQLSDSELSNIKTMNDLIDTFIAKK